MTNTNLNNMDYTQFTEYLKSKNIEFTEEKWTDIDEYFTIIISVIPQHSKLKERMFDTDGGAQLK